MTEAERIDFLINSLESGNKTRFAERIGCSLANLWKIRNGEIGIRLRVDTICMAYPQINRSWLETGEGYPGDLTTQLVREHYLEKINRAEKTIDQLMKRIEDLERQIDNR